MKTAGVALDAWKLPVFKKHLDAAGYKYTEHRGPSANVLVLKVEYEWVAKLLPVIKAANDECAATGGPRYDIPEFLRKKQ